MRTAIPYPWVKRKKAYWIWLHTAGRLLSLACGLKVTGRENIPEKGGALIVANHKSYLDPPLIAFAVRKRPVFFMAKEELFSTPVLSFLIKHWGNAFPVSRGKVDRRAIKSALAVINSGEILCIFPEGRRTPPGKFLSPRWGAGMVAIKTEAPVIPCLIEGTEKILGSDSIISGIPRVSIKFGKSFFIELEDKKENYQKAADILMEKIRELLK